MRNRLLGRYAVRNAGIVVLIAAGGLFLVLGVIADRSARQSSSKLAILSLDRSTKCESIELLSDCQRQFTSGARHHVTSVAIQNVSTNDVDVFMLSKSCGCLDCKLKNVELTVGRDGAVRLTPAELQFLELSQPLPMKAGVARQDVVLVSTAHPSLAWYVEAAVRVVDDIELKQNSVGFEGDDNTITVTARFRDARKGPLCATEIRQRYLEQVSFEAIRSEERKGDYGLYEIKTAFSVQRFGEDGKSDPTLKSRQVSFVVSCSGVELGARTILLAAQKTGAKR